MKNEVKVSGNTIIIVYNGVQTTRIISKIRFCKAKGHFSEIQFDTGKPVKAPICIDALAAMLPEESFFKCHRRYIINFFILHESVVKKDKIIYDKHILPVSRYKKKEFKKRSDAYYGLEN